MIEDKLIKLSKLWCEDNNIIVTVANGGLFYTCYDNNSPKEIVLSSTIIQLPNSLKNTLIDYRLCRFGAWHESMHVIHTSNKLVDRIKDTHINIDAFNIIEDYRVETLGLQTYSGYINEKKFEYEVLEKKYDSLNPVTSLGNYIMLRLNAPHLLKEDTYPKKFIDYKEDIDALCIRILSELGNDLKNEILTVELSNELSNILKRIQNKEFVRMDKGSLYSRNTSSGFIHSGGVKKILESCDRGGVSDSILKEYADIRDEVKEYADGISNIFGDKFDEYKELDHDSNYMYRVNAKENIQEASKLQSMASGIMRRLELSIRNLQKEVSDYEDDCGDDIEIDKYLSHDNKFYINEDINRPINDILLLLDISGSTYEVHDSYLASALAVCESFNHLGIRYGVYAFSQPFGDKELKIIKAKDEKYSPIIKYRLGGAKSGGRTPLASLMFTIKNVLHRYKYIILFTDGESTEAMSITKKAFSEVHAMNKPLYMIGYTSKEAQNPLKHYAMQILHAQDRRNFIEISDITQLPTAIMKVVGNSWS